MAQKMILMKNNKYIKLFEDFKDNSDLEKELKKYGIKNYIINSDGTIDVDGNVNLSTPYPTPFFKKLNKIPFKFGIVSGTFNCSYNNLESLEGSPYYVGIFFCHQNKLTSLEGSPVEVGGTFNCSYNNLESLEGMPLEIGDNFNCRNNYLNELDSISNIEGTIYCDIETDTSKFKGFCKDIKRSIRTKN